MTNDMRLLFVLDGFCSLKYFIPLAREAKVRGHTCVFKITPYTGKYNGAGRHLDKIKQLILRHGFREGDGGDICISVEGVCMEEGYRNYVLVSMLDYMSLYRTYVDKADYVVFPSRWFVERASKAYSECSLYGPEEISDIDVPHKNLFLGSPKYDIKLNRKDICRKYSLDPAKKYGLIMYPRVPDEWRTDISGAIKDFEAKGLVPLMKSRKKDPISRSFNVRDFYDASFFPSTSMELIHISEEVINTDSATVKEAVMLDTPIRNIESKGYRVLEELYEPDAKKKYLWTGNSSSKIVSHMEEHV